MNALAQLDGLELLLVLALIALIGWELLQALRSRSWVAVYRPTLFVAAVLGYYTLAGPLRALALDGPLYRGLDHRQLLLWGWLGAVLSYGSLLLGFYASPRTKAPKRLILNPNPQRIHRLGLHLCQLGLLMFALVTGTRLVALFNPLAAGQLIEGGLGERGVDVGAITNYFTYAVNFLIPGLCLMAAAWLRQRRHTPVLVLWLLAALTIYTSLGFRYRLVLLAIPILLLWFMARRKRPSLAMLAVFLAGFITLNGLIGLTRSYGRGLDLTAIEGQSTADLVDAGFGESAVFFTTSGVIEQAPGRSSFIGGAPIINTLLFPIPRSIYPSKPDVPYGAEATAMLYGGENFARGSAFLNYAEYYLIAGWPSLIALSALLGWLLRRLWNWFLIRQDEPFAQALYLLTASYLYVVISRGYLPQVVMLFGFSVAPLFWLYGRWSQPVAQLASPSAPPLPRG
ncbi:hypothetical protein VB716_10700 [Synechococcus sp. CCY9201]|uniref:hypothetical protein n=1 Tax=Synechococcus sp. CCY9201 TaxID=174697 RepID=UPI002B219733|nr:hypothetical protein [Synechococcus sp. CCY9201]MEA5474689.1 hypothetical protein [Synechococcus sp. CCY9201]